MFHLAVYNYRSIVYEVFFFEMTVANYVNLVLRIKLYYYYYYYTNISTIDESDYRRSKTSFEYVNRRSMQKVTKCIGVKSFVEALINMVCELKITSGCKKNV